MDVAERHRRNGGVADAGAVVRHCLQPVGDAEAPGLLALQRVFGLGDPRSRRPVASPRHEERSARSATQPQRVRVVHRVVPGVSVGLAGLGHVGIDAEELPGPRVVVAPN